MSTDEHNKRDLASARHRLTDVVSRTGVAVDELSSRIDSLELEIKCLTSTRAALADKRIAAKAALGWLENIPGEGTS